MIAASDTGSSNTDNATRINTPAIAIAAPGAGETPSLYVDGVKVAATFDPATNTLTPTVPLADGPHSVTYTLTNANGESAQSPALAVVIDTIAPAAQSAASSARAYPSPPATKTNSPGAKSALAPLVQASAPA